MKVIDKTIPSRELLKPEMRLPHQTTSFIYKALDLAESQIEEQFDEIERLRRENLRLSKLSKKDNSRN
jgi:hypothetical protein